MRIIIPLLITFILPAVAPAVETARDRTHGVSEGKIDLAKIRSHLQIKAEIFVTDPSGHQIFEKGSQWRLLKSRNLAGKPLIEHQWTSGSSEYGTFRIRHVWEIQDDGTLRATIEQYEHDEQKEEGGEVKYTHLLKKEVFNIENFSPINWVSLTPQPGYRVIVRFSPDLSDEPEVQDLNGLPVAGHEMMITDNQGGLWTDRQTISGKYVGFITHRGSIFLSYVPFSGAKEMGIAQGHRIEINLDANRALTFTSLVPLLPEGLRAKVYAIWRDNQRTPSFTRVRSVSSNREKDFLTRLSP